MLRHFRSTSSLRTTTKHSLFYVLMVAIWNWISMPRMYTKRTCTRPSQRTRYTHTQQQRQRHRDTLDDFVHFSNNFAIIGRIYVSMLNEKIHKRRLQWRIPRTHISQQKGKFTSETQTHLWTRNCLTRVVATEMGDSSSSSSSFFLFF